MRAIGFPIGMSLGGLLSALLVVAAGEALVHPPLAPGYRPTEDGTGRSCASFLVSPHRPGDTHLLLANVSQQSLTALVELLDETGSLRSAESYHLEPFATRDVVIGRPPPESGIKVSSGDPHFTVSAKVVFDDGSEPEPYRAGGCA